MADTNPVNNTSTNSILLSPHYAEVIVANALTSTVHCIEPRATKTVIGGHVKKHVVFGTSVWESIFPSSSEPCELSGRCVTAVVDLKVPSRVGAANITGFQRPTAEVNPCGRK